MSDADKMRLNPYPSGKKRCGKCREIKPLIEFYKCRSNFGGISMVCKTCDKSNTRIKREKRLKKGQGIE